MDLEKKLKQAEEVIRLGNEFYDKILEMRNTTPKENEQLGELIKTDERFISVENKFTELSEKLGI